MKTHPMLPWLAAAALLASATAHASEPRGRTAVAAPSAPASTAFIDAKTGELRQGTAREQAALGRLPSTAQWPANEAEAAQTRVLHSNGMESILVPTDRMVFTRADIDADGNVTVTHFDPENEHDHHGHSHAVNQERPHE